MSHLFSNLQDHLSGAFRPGLVPSNTSSVSIELLNSDVTFATDTGWDLGGANEWTIGSGVLRAEPLERGEILSCSFTSPLEIGKEYLLSFTTVSIPGGAQITVFAGYDYEATRVISSTPGLATYSFTVTTAAATSFTATLPNPFGDIFTLDNISLVEV